jgi:serine/threonine protein kinase
LNVGPDQDTPQADELPSTQEERRPLTPRAEPAEHAPDLSDEIFTSAADVTDAPRPPRASSQELTAALLEPDGDGAEKQRLDQTILGRYKIQNILGRGAFSVVYRASQIGVGRVVALKVFLLHPASRQNQKLAEAALVRFQREARLASQLRHPNTVTLYDYDKTDTSIFYMAFEYVEGPTLSRAIKDHPGGLTARRAIQIARQVALSLEEAHSQGIIHRDLKPGNIMLARRKDDSDHVKVLDFGIAKLVEDSEEDPNRDVDLSDELEVLDLTGLDQDNNAELTLDGRIVGTPRYIPPEQIHGHRLGPSADLYALGLILHEMLTGHPANPGRRAQDLIKWHLEDHPFHLPEGFKYPPGLAHVVQKSTRKDAAARYQSCRELLDDLDRLDDNGHWRKQQRPGLIRAIVAVNLLLLAALAFTLYSALQSDTTAPPTPTPAAPTAPAPTLTAPPLAPPPQPQAPPEPPPEAPPTPTPAAVQNLHITSDPDGAEVYLGELLIGQTPLQLALEERPADMTLTLKKRGFKTQDVRWRADSLQGRSPSPFPVQLQKARAPAPNQNQNKYRILP